MPEIDELIAKYDNGSSRLKDISPEKLEQLKKFDRKYLYQMTEEEINICGGVPLKLLAGYEGTNIYECIWFNYTPVYLGLPPRWDVDWDNFEG